MLASGGIPQHYQRRLHGAGLRVRLLQCGIRMRTCELCLSPSEAVGREKGGTAWKCYYCLQILGITHGEILGPSPGPDLFQLMEEAQRKERQ